MPHRSAMRQAAIFCLTVAVISVLLIKLDVVRRINYQAAKGRLQAAHEALDQLDDVRRMEQVDRLVAEIVTPAVVNIDTVRHVNGRDLLDELSRWRRSNDTDDEDDDDVERMEPGGWDVLQGLGSGVIIDAERGFILTNNHVIDGSDKVRVQLYDGRRLDAEVVGADPRSDLAVVCIDATGLHELELGDSDALRVGDAVYTVGNPFGLGGTFSKGVISALDRSSMIHLNVEYQNFIQTDALINPGNSGGPLVNTHGQVVGINTAIATDTGQFVGVGFAIPAKRAKRIVPALIAGQEVVRGFLGVQIRNVIGSATPAEELQWPHGYGVLVTDVLADSPAQEGGLLPDDIISTIEGHRLQNPSDLTDLIAMQSPGSTVTLDVWREGRSQKLAIKVGRQPRGFTTSPWLRPAE